MTTARFAKLCNNRSPPVNTEIHRDLWPAVLRKLEARPAQMPWYDWALIGLSSAVFLLFPQLILVFAYHL